MSDSVTKITMSAALDIYGDAADELVAGTGTVCQLKMILPTVRRGAGANRAARANSSAR